MPSKKYLTTKEFDEWKDNHFHSLVKKVIRIEAVNWTTVAFLGVILALICFLGR